MWFKKARCPQCHKALSLLVFAAHLKRAAGGDSVFTTCSHCKAVLHAQSNEAHQQNFVWIFLFPLLATPVILSLQSFVGSSVKPIYFFLSYALCIFLPTVRGQHLMNFSVSSEAALKQFLASPTGESTDVKSETSL